MLGRTQRRQLGNLYKESRGSKVHIHFQTTTIRLPIRWNGYVVLWLGQTIGDNQFDVSRVDRCTKNHNMTGWDQTMKLLSELVMTGMVQLIEVQI